MKPSLNEIAENLAYAFDKQNDFTFREALKHTVNLYREKLLREEDTNSGLNYNDFTQSIVLPLEEYSHPICGTSKVTVSEVPDSIRFKRRGRVNYYFVGTKDFVKPFTQTTLAEWEFLKHVKNQTSHRYYVIEDEKIIILGEIKMCDIGIKGVFSNPRLLEEICVNPEHLTDDAPYPLGGDLLTIIRQGILRGDFPVRLGEEEGVIKSNSENEK